MYRIFSCRQFNFLFFLDRYTSLVAGDWLELSNRLKDKDKDNAMAMAVDKMPTEGKFDLILAAEMTYTLSLKPEVGVGLITTQG